MSKSIPVISCRKLSKSFTDANKQLLVLNEIDFEVFSNQSVAILGASGSGKSTLLHILGGLEFPSSGDVYWNSDIIYNLSETKKCYMRNRHLGFVYQFHHLLPEFNALENVAMPLLIAGCKIRDAKRMASKFLSYVGLSDRETHKPKELSGGERQRVAIARALVMQPKCVLADEPTGNLDQQTAKDVLQVMLDLQKEFGIAFVIATHNLQLANVLTTRYNLIENVLKA